MSTSLAPEIAPGKVLVRAYSRCPGCDTPLQVAALIDLDLGPTRKPEDAARDLVTKLLKGCKPCNTP